MLIPQIWHDALIKSTKQSVASDPLFDEMMAEYERLHKARMETDADYAREYEEFEREWKRLGEE